MLTHHHPTSIRRAAALPCRAAEHANNNNNNTNKTLETRAASTDAGAFPRRRPCPATVGTGVGRGRRGCGGR